MLLKGKDMEIVWNDFKTMRKRKKKPLTEGAEKRQWNKVTVLAENGLSEANIIDHLHTVCDSLWDNVFSNEDHLSQIILKYNKNQKSINPNGSNQNKPTGSNYYTYHKGTAYEETATRLLDATREFDFIAKIRQ